MSYVPDKSNTLSKPPRFQQNSRKRGLLLFACVALALITTGSGAWQHNAFAQVAQNRAGLVIQFPDNDVETYCLTFDGDTISGLDLLIKSGLLLKVEAYGGLGAEVCQIGQTGCDYPNATCACQSYGVNGVYWSYHHLTNGQWRASLVGAGSYKVHPGDVEGWAWSGGTPPALYTFDQLCPAAEPPATEVPPTPTQPEPTATPTTPPPTNTPQPTRTRTPTRTPRPAQPTTTSTTQPEPQNTVGSSTPILLVPTDTATELPPTPTETDTPAIAPTSTMPSTPEPTRTPAPTSTPIVMSTDTPIATPTATATPIAPASNPEGTARTLGLYIAGGVAIALAVWGIFTFARRRTQKARGE